MFVNVRHNHIMYGCVTSNRCVLAMDFWCLTSYFEQNNTLNRRQVVLLQVTNGDSSEAAEAQNQLHGSCSVIRVPFPSAL